MKSQLPCRKQLRHSEIMWFDEAFLAVLQERLGDMRSMFGFGSGRGDFERYFSEQVCILQVKLQQAWQGANSPYSGLGPRPDREPASKAYLARQMRVYWG